MAEHTIPGGRNKGTPISEAPDSDLNYWIDRISGDLEANPEKKFADRDRAWVDAANAVLERRGMGGGSPPEAQSAPRAAPAPRQQKPRQQARALTLGASLAHGENLMTTLERLSEKALLVAPTLACESLPEGAEIAISMVRADTKSQDCYVTRGDRKRPEPNDELGLGSPILQRIAGAAGISWVREATVRTDDGRNPYKVGYRTWARIQDIDGSFRDWPGDCEVDLSDGGPQALDIIEKAKKRDRDPQKQLAEARKFIQRSTLTKAMNTATRKACGLRHSYTREELETKPFAVVKLLFTGRTEDPDLKPLFAQLVAQRFGLSAPQLYAAPKTRHINTTGVPVTDYGDEPEPYDTGEADPVY